MLSDAAEIIWTVCPPVIIIVGMVGNILSIIVLVKFYNYHSSFIVYVTALQIFDTLALVFYVLPEWLAETFAIYLYDYHDLLCRFYFFTTFLLPEMTSWLIVALSLERMACTWFPLKVKSLCRAKYSYLTVLGLFVILCTLNAHNLYGIEHVNTDVVVYDNATMHSHRGNNNICTFVSEEYKRFYDKVYPWIVAMTLCFIPSAIIIPANVATVYKVVTSKVTLRTHTPLHVRGSSYSSGIGKSRSVLFITISISVTFVLLTSPLSILGLGELYWVEDWWSVSSHTNVFDAVLFNITFLNHAVNFALFLFSGRRFRRKLRELFTLSGRSCFCGTGGHWKNERYRRAVIYSKTLTNTYRKPI